MPDQCEQPLPQGKPGAFELPASRVQGRVWGCRTAPGLELADFRLEGGHAMGTAAVVQVFPRQDPWRASQAGQVFDRTN
jgi:hypothetical protein